MRKIIKNGTTINEGIKAKFDILIENDIITNIANDIDASLYKDAEIIDAEGCFVIPGVIDDQVHFREPGLTHKGSIAEGSRAAVTGGVTSFMDMPNVVPATTTNALLKEKQAIGAKDSVVNYTFYLGATQDNIEEIKNLDPHTTCGVKIFMGSSTGNMLVDKEETLEQIFKYSPIIIATHCEDTPTIERNLEIYKEKYGDNIPAECHPLIRSHEACLLSSQKASALARKHGARLHILHLSTAQEIDLLDKGELKNKRITGEACVHHLWFNDDAYKVKGNLVKWNPAIKLEEDRKAVLKAVANGTINVIATDHAPHTLEEKTGVYTKSASGGPLIGHSLVTMLQLTEQGEITMEQVVQGMCHAPAEIFDIEKRGFLRIGYKADIAIFKKESWIVSKDNLPYQCGWSPLEGQTFDYKVVQTLVNGVSVFMDGIINEDYRGELLTFSH